MRKNAPLT